MTNRSFSGGPRSAGFTLIELLVTLTVLAVLLALAAPSFANLIAANRIGTRAGDLVAALGDARAEAIRRSASVALRARDGADYAGGWWIRLEGDDRLAPLRDTAAFRGKAAIVRVVRSTTAPFTYTASAAADRGLVRFGPRGALDANTPAWFRICDTAHPTVPGRIVQVNVVGKISLDSTTERCA